MDDYQLLALMSAMIYSGTAGSGVRKPPVSAKEAVGLAAELLDEVFSENFRRAR